jgi:hypothetical protein
MSMNIVRSHPGRKGQNAVRLAGSLLLLLVSASSSEHAQTTAISTGAYEVLGQRVGENRANFWVYRDQDSGLNRGFPSGLFANTTANLSTVHVDTGCIDDPLAANGCSTNPLALNRSRGTVLRVSFDAQTPGSFAGLNIEEPENWGVSKIGAGYDLRGATSVSFDVRSPAGAMVQFGVGQCVTEFMAVSQMWTTRSFPLSALMAAPGTGAVCPPVLEQVHVLFTVATNWLASPNGATVLIDNVQFLPAPTSSQAALGFPRGNDSFGVLPRSTAPLAPDQINRNLTTIYESALTELTLLGRRSASDLVNARLIADTFHYALHHDNDGDPLPTSNDGSIGLHNGYESGDVALLNNQQPPRLGQAGGIRLPGFTSTLCAPSNYCLLLDGATGGNNAFAILALVAAFRQFGDATYLADARTIGKWIIGNLTDASGTGFGGYFLGYPDRGVPPPKPLQKGKSVENNADIFAAFTVLASVEAGLGNAPAAAQWTDAANAAGEFVMEMFDAAGGRFNAGTVPSGTAPGPGVCPTGAQQGNEVVNVCDFLDSNSFTTLALTSSPAYRNRIDWRRPIDYALNTFGQTVTAGGTSFSGFSLTPAPPSGPAGVAWEFTGQMCETMRVVDRLYSENALAASIATCLAEISKAQAVAPFSDGNGLVAATLPSGDSIPPIAQCIDTPFQCIAERVGLAATAWAILAEQDVNILLPPTLPLSVALAPSVPPPVPAGEPVTWTATVTGGRPPYTYEFWLFNGKTWTLAQDWSVANTWTWTPSTPGTYSIQVWVRNAGSTADYDAWQGTSPYTVTGLVVTTFTASRASPLPVGEPVTWSATAAGGIAPYTYEFWLFNGKTWTLAQDWSAANTWTWTPSTPGTYSIQVWVRNAGSTADYDAWQGTSPYSVTGLVVTTFTASRASPVAVGEPVTCSATAAGGIAPYTYEFWLFNGKAWTLAQGWSAANAWTWTPAASGTYWFQVWVRNAGSTADYDAWQGTSAFIVSGQAGQLVTSTTGVRLGNPARR